MQPDQDKKWCVALAVGLIDHTFERVGNSESAEDGHFGVTGWKVKHVSFSEGSAVIRYVGKSGVKHKKVVDDALLVRALKKAVKGKTPEDEVCGGITSRDVNAYLEPFDVTAKDIRGYHANRTMAEHLRAVRKKGPKLPTDRKEKDKILKAEFKEALDATAEAVGHEAATLRSQYLSPGVEDDYMKDGTVSDTLKDASKRDKTAIIHVDNATDGPEGSDLRGRAGMLSSLTLLEQAVMEDMLIHGEPIVRADAEARQVGWTYPAGTYLLRGHEVRPDVVTELDAAGYLAEHEPGVFVVSPKLEAKLQLYTRTARKVASAWMRQATTHYVPMHVERAVRYPMAEEPTKVWEWSLMQDPPTERSRPQGRNSIPADRGHDWQWKNGRFWYSGTGGRKDAWLILQYGPDAGEMDDAKSCPSCGVPMPGNSRFCPGCGALQKVATKSDGEREEEEVERLSRPSPKKKPPRDDSKRERVEVERDPDVDTYDKDLSQNYKDVGG